MALWLSLDPSQVMSPSSLLRTRITSTSPKTSSSLNTRSLSNPCLSTNHDSALSIVTPPPDSDLDDAEQQVRQRRNLQFVEGHEEYVYRLDASTGCRYYLSCTTHSFFCHHDGNHAATCGQRGTGSRVNLQPGVNSVFFFFEKIVPDE